MTNKEIIKHVIRKFDFVNSIGMKLKLMQPGSFMMGSESRQTDERPVHRVTITKPFYIGIYEVTQAEYKAIMGTNPSWFKGDDRPVEQVSWNIAKEFCRQLSEKEGRTYRLLTEAEWEYCCRAGTTTKYYWGDKIDGNYLWYYENSDRQTHPVGQKLPNAWGLYDMAGNVWEWCEDRYGSYSPDEQTDPAGPSEGLFRVLRGGSWKSVANNTRSVDRNYSIPSSRYRLVGFRVVMEATK